MACHKINSLLFPAIKWIYAKCAGPLSSTQAFARLLIKEMLNIKQNLLSGFASGSLDTCQNVSIPNFTKRLSKVVIVYITREATLAHAKALLIFYNVRRLNRASSFKPGLSLAHLQGFKLHENMTFLTPLSWSYSTVYKANWDWPRGLSCLPFGRNGHSSDHGFAYRNYTSFLALLYFALWPQNQADEHI